MRKVLIDSSAWIEYFAGNPKAGILSDFIDNNFLCINDLILTELVPFLRNKKEEKLISLLRNVENIPLNIDWNGLIDLQGINLKHGLYNISIPDLIIAQNVINNNLELFSFDKHFILMQRFVKFKLFY